MSEKRVNRRDFLAHSGLIMGIPSLLHRSPEKSPNVLVIMTDQQSAHMMSCTGSRWLETPAMDSLMKRGMRFEKAYATNPVCVPSRFSLLSGFYPSAINIRANGQSEKAEAFVSRSMGHTFSRAGYETVYGGKVHLPGAMRNISSCGFRNLTDDRRDGLAEACANFLEGKPKQPFLLFASFINPHDICYQAIRAEPKSNRKENREVEVVLRAAERLPKGVSREKFFKELCPPLPANHEPAKDEPKSVSAFRKQRSFKQWVYENWSDEDWRLHRWTYARLTERVDRQIGVVLDAFRRSGLEEETIVVFTSDHGDMDASHKLEHKSMTYEEAARIPFIIQAPGLTEGGRVDRKHLVSNGLDLLPTLCELTGVKPPEGLPGRSLRPLLSGSPPQDWRTYLMIETEVAYGVTDGRYKYSLFDFAGRQETLFDLHSDPGEMKNLVEIVKHRNTLERMREALSREARTYGVELTVQ